MKYLLQALQQTRTSSPVVRSPARGRHQVGISMATSFLFRERARSRLFVPNPFECADSKVTEKCLESDRLSLSIPLLHSSNVSLRPYVTRSVPELLIISIYIVCVVGYSSENHRQSLPRFMALLSSLYALVPRSSLSLSLSFLVLRLVQRQLGWEAKKKKK